MLSSLVHLRADDRRIYVYLVRAPRRLDANYPPPNVIKIGLGFRPAMSPFVDTET